MTAHDGAVGDARKRRLFEDRGQVSEVASLSGELAAARSDLAAAKARVAELEAHILDIDAHATPFGDIPDDPGWVGTYLVTAGSLHRALGKIGHTAPSCDAEERIARALAEIDSGWTNVDLIRAALAGDAGPDGGERA